MIKYYTKLCVNSRQTPLTISNDEVNSEEQDYEQFLEWLAKVSEVFGSYSIGG